MSSYRPRVIDARQADFIRLYVDYGDVRRAAIEAGYSENSLEHCKNYLLNKPEIAMAIARAARPRLARMVPLALGTLEHLAEHAISEKVKLDASKAILDRAGLVPPKAQEDRSAIEPPLHEMSSDELRARAARLEDELAGRAKPISADPAPLADAHKLDGDEVAKPIEAPDETPSDDDPDDLFGTST